MSHIQSTLEHLVAFHTTHSRREEQERCLAWCVDFFAGAPVLVSHHMSRGVPSCVIANTPGTEFDVLFLVHIDEAEGETRVLDFNDAEGRVYGRGLADMKAFVATSLCAMRDLIEQKTVCRIGLMLTSDEEEGGADGARYLFEDCGYRAAVVLVPDDGDDIGRVVVASKHMLTYTITAHGRAVHASRPWDGVNAVDALMRTLARVMQTFPGMDDAAGGPWRSTCAVTHIAGGSAVNELPGTATATLDIRLVPPTTRGDVEALLAEACGADCTYVCDFEGYPTQLDTKSPAVRTYIEILEQMLGRPVVYKQSGGGTDGRYAAQCGMPVIVHQGTCGDAQGEHEYVDLASLEQLVAVQVAYVSRLADAVSNTKV